MSKARRFQVVMAIVGGVTVVGLLVWLAIALFGRGGDAPEGQSTAPPSASGPAGVETLPEQGWIVQPATDDPALYGAAAALVLYNYDTSAATYGRFESHVESWAAFRPRTEEQLQRPGAEPYATYINVGATVWNSPLVKEEGYRVQSENRVVVTAELIGEPSINDHRALRESPARAELYEMSAQFDVTSELEVRYTYPNADGSERVDTETLFVSVRVACGQTVDQIRLTEQCRVLEWYKEYLI